MNAAPASVPTSEGLFLVSYGKSRGVGCFVADASHAFARGMAVVVRTMRGLESGTVLCPASVRQAKLLGSASAGRLLRPLSHEDQARLDSHQRLGQQVFEQASGLAQRLQLPLEILDVEVMFDGNQAVLQFLGSGDADFEPLVHPLEETFSLEIRLENLSRADEHDHEDEHQGGCGKPDCGRTSGGGCTTCGDGGGCSSCGSAKVDMGAYFAHLRERMEAQPQRTPLL